jgi:hypothetical protein
MKLNIIFLVTLMVILSVNTLAQAQNTGGDLNIEIIGQNPSPVEPGENVEIEVEIQNNAATQSSIDTTVEIVPQDPFSLLNIADKIKIFKKISPESSVKVSYTLSVSDSALTGSYDLEFKVKDQATQIYTTEKIPITVRGTPNIILEDVGTSETIEAGGEAELFIVIKNMGTGKASQMELEFNSTSEIIPILSKGLIYVGDLEPGESKSSVISLSIDSGAEHRTYTTKLTASYKDEENTQQSKTFDVGIPVKGTIKLVVLKVEADYERNKLEIEIANKGTSEAKSLESKLYVDGELVDIDYKSQLKENKKVTLNFPLVYEGEGSLEISYIGPGIENNVITEDISLNFTKPSTDGTSLYLLVFIIVVIVVVVYWRKRKKKHHHKKH